jgi:hypothetical protein
MPQRKFGCLVTLPKAKPHSAATARYMRSFLILVAIAVSGSAQAKFSHTYPTHIPRYSQMVARAARQRRWPRNAGGAQCDPRHGWVQYYGQKSNLRSKTTLLPAEQVR